MYSFGEQFAVAAETLEQERNISKEAFTQAIADAILAAYKKKNETTNENIKTYFEEETMSIGIFAPLVVAENVEDPHIQISLEEARGFIDDIQIGEEVEVDITPEDFSEYGRIAVNIARQIVRQKLNEEEKKLLHTEYEAVKNRVLVAEVSNVEQRADGDGQHVIVSLGRIEALLPPREQIPGHRYKKGERVRVYISDIQERNKRLSIIASQAHEELLGELFRLEIPEIDEGVIDIIGKARVAGRRSKIAVRSNNPDVDPIGACIGARGSRIQNIISELYNEKVDIVPWSEDPVEFISYALSPTQISEIALFDDNRALVVVPDDQLSLAIGKGGQNVRLATQLTGWKLDIRSESDAAKEEQKESASAE